MDASYKSDKKIDNSTMELIANRVAEFNKRQNYTENSSNEMGTHLEALAQVFDLDKSDVEKIAQDVLIKQSHRKGFKDKLIDGVIKYSKEVIVSIIIITVVSLLLLGRSSLQSTQSPVLSEAMGMTSVLALDPGQFKTKAKIIEVMALTSPIRWVSHEYYMGEDEFPNSLDKVGLDRNEMKTEKGIEDLMLGKDGSIIIKLDEKIGADLILKISPEISMGGMSLKWKCRSNFKGYLPTCDKFNADKELALFQ